MFAGLPRGRGFRKRNREIDCRHIGWKGDRRNRTRPQPGTTAMCIAALFRTVIVARFEMMMLNRFRCRRVSARKCPHRLLDRNGRHEKTEAKCDYPHSAQRLPRLSGSDHHHSSSTRYLADWSNRTSVPSARNRADDCRVQRTECSAGSVSYPVTLKNRSIALLAVGVRRRRPY